MAHPDHCLDDSHIYALDKLFSLERTTAKINTNFPLRSMAHLFVYLVLGFLVGALAGILFYNILYVKLLNRYVSRIQSDRSK